MSTLNQHTTRNFENNTNNREDFPTTTYHIYNHLKNLVYEYLRSLTRYMKLNTLSPISSPDITIGGIKCPANIAAARSPTLPK